MGGAHGRITVGEGVVGEYVDVGFVPTMTGIPVFRKPPRMLGRYDPGVPSKGEFRPLSHFPSRGFDDDPIALFNPFL